MGEVETALAAIWARGARLERVGRHDNFFELGGHSLLAVSVIERMRRAGLHADVRALFTTPTLAALAKRSRAAQRRRGRGAAEPHPARAATRITPEMLPLVELTAGRDRRASSRRCPGGAANIQDIYPLAPLQEGILFHHLMATRGRSVSAVAA